MQCLLIKNTEIFKMVASCYYGYQLIVLDNENYTTWRHKFLKIYISFTVLTFFRHCLNVEGIALRQMTKYFMDCVSE